MRLYIVVPKKFSLEDTSSVFAKKVLPLENMIEEIRKSTKLIAFNKLEDAKSYRSFLHHKQAKKILFGNASHDKLDFPLFTVEVDIKVLNGLKSQILHNDFMRKDLSFREITQDIINKIVSVDVGTFKNHQLVTLSDLPIEILLKISSSNLSLTDIRNLMLTQKQFNNLFNSDNGLVRQFWKIKQDLYQPFNANTAHGLKSFRENYKNEVNSDRHFQWILNRAKEGDLRAFINFSFDKHAELIYTQKDKNGMTVLDWLKIYNHKHILQWLFKNKKLIPLFKKNYDFHPENAETDMELLSAICLDQADAVEEILMSNNFPVTRSIITSSKNGRIDRADNHSIIALAVAFNSVNVTKNILLKASDEMKEDLISSYEFIENFRSNSFEMSKLLLQTHASLKDEWPSILLHYSVRNSDLRVLKLVLDVVTNQVNSKVSFPRRRPKLVFHKVLRSVFEDGTELTPLHIAAYTKNIPAMELLLGSGASIDEMANGMTSLQLAAKNGKNTAVKFLLEHQANPFLKGDHNMQAMHHAVASGSSTCVQLLLECYKQNNLLENLCDGDNSGNNVLHYAKGAEILQLLLHSGMASHLINSQNADKLPPISWRLVPERKAELAVFILNNSKLVFKSNNPTREQTIYNAVYNFIQSVKKDISKHERNVLSFVIAGLKWYTEQTLFTGYWFNDKEHARTVLKHLINHGTTMSDTQLLNFLQKNIMPSDPNNELGILKVLLTEKVYEKLDIQNQLLSKNSLDNTKQNLKEEDKISAQPVQKSGDLTTSNSTENSEENKLPSAKTKKEENYTAMRDRLFLAAETRRLAAENKKEDKVDDKLEMQHRNSM